MPGYFIHMQLPCCIHRGAQEAGYAQRGVGIGLITVIMVTGDYGDSNRITSNLHHRKTPARACSRIFIY